MKGSEEKRRRLVKDSEEKSRKKKKTKTVRKELERAEEVAATEEEVEEFFAILKRIHAARKYFGEGWRTAVEGEVVVRDGATEVVEKDNINGDEEEETVTRKKGERLAVVKEDQNGVLDLNSMPKEESHLANG